MIDEAFLFKKSNIIKFDGITNNGEAFEARLKQVPFLPDTDADLLANFQSSSHLVGLF